MNLHSLENLRGDAVEILRLRRSPDGMADLSLLDWPSSLAVLTGLTFMKVKIDNLTIRSNLVECTIEDSTFSRLVSDGHFWGASNHWSQCHFKNVDLQNVISPQSSFEECIFEDVRLTGYHPCETMFSHCIFKRTIFLGMKAKRARGFKINPELGKGASILFADCSFSECIFRNCCFAEVGFCRTTFSGVKAENCDFRGVVSDKHWWNENAEKDPYVAFLDEVVTMIKIRLGEQSQAYQAMQDYRKDFIAGKTANRDYSACLFDGRVSYQDFLKIETGIAEIEARYPI